MSAMYGLCIHNSTGRTRVSLAQLWTTLTVAESHPVTPDETCSWEPPPPAGHREQRLRTAMDWLVNATAAAAGQACWTPPYWHPERDPVVASLREATRHLALALGDADQPAAAPSREEG